MSSLKTLLKSKPVLFYFIITFTVSWVGFILALGPSGFSSQNVWSTNSMGFAIMAMLSGPTIAGLLMTGIVDGKEGFHRLFYSLVKWRVGIKWYAIAVLAAPILSVLVLLWLSMKCPLFTAANKAAVLIPGIVAGLTTVFEEIGWTGFAVPRLRKRYGILKTGLIVGVLWGLWHLLQQLFIGGTYAGEVPRTLYISAALFNAIAGLTAYRILLVWLNDRTGSLLLTTLMHASLTASNVFIFRPEAVGAHFLTFGLVFAAAQWVVVSIVAMVDRRGFSG